MKIVGYYIHGNKEYVAFRETKSKKGYKITDGFHDRSVNERNKEKYAGYKPVERIDLQKIIDRMRGTRPWHPLLEILRKEAAGYGRV